MIDWNHVDRPLLLATNGKRERNLSQLIGIGHSFRGPIADGSYEFHSSSCKR